MTRGVGAPRRRARVGGTARRWRPRRVVARVLQRCGIFAVGMLVALGAQEVAAGMRGGADFELPIDDGAAYTLPQPLPPTSASAGDTTAPDVDGPRGARALAGATPAVLPYNLFHEPPHRPEAATGSGSDTTDDSYHPPRITRFSGGRVLIEYFDNGTKLCNSWVLVPGEMLWSRAVRGVLYFVGLAYFLLGIAIISDIFMAGIERITSAKEVVEVDSATGESRTVTIEVWNETVANLTLLALGSSAPEILLSLIESLVTLNSEPGELGASTIVGSAAFNLLIISAVCMYTCEETKQVEQFGVFLITTFTSFFAYFWMVAVLVLVSACEVTIWEALLTLGYFPMLVLVAWAQDRNWFRGDGSGGGGDTGDDSGGYQQHKRILNVGVEDSSPRGGPVGGDTAAPAGRSLSLQRTSSTKRQSTLSGSGGGASGGIDQDHAKAVEDIWRHLQQEGVDVDSTEAEALLSQRANAKLAGGFSKAIYRMSSVKYGSQAIKKQLHALNAAGGVGDGAPAVVRVASDGLASPSSAAPSANPLVPAATDRRYSGGAAASSDAAGARSSSSTVDVTSTSRVSEASFLNLTLGADGGTGSTRRHRSDTIGAAATRTVSVAVLQWQNSSYTFMENEGHALLVIVRTGTPNGTVTVRYATSDGTACAGRRYVATEGVAVLEAGQMSYEVRVPLVDDKAYQEEEVFYVELSEAGGGAQLPARGLTKASVTIIDDDIPGYFEFCADPHEPVKQSTVLAPEGGAVDVQVQESQGHVTLYVKRYLGQDGRVTASVVTAAGTGAAGKDYVHLERELEFADGEDTKTVRIPVMDHMEYQKETSFSVGITTTTGGAAIGPKRRANITIVADERLAGLIARIVGDVQVRNTLVKETAQQASSWSQQFRDAMQLDVDGDDDDGGGATAVDYILHFLTMFWRVLFAAVPPSSYGNGWGTFAGALAFIALVTAVVAELASLLGCVLGVEDAVVAITFVALGTSLPDTFASKTAIENESTADAAIGNVMGSNSVNVFLGLGLPWTIVAVYKHVRGVPYAYPASGLVFSVILFLSCAVLAVLLLLYNRMHYGGEMGGPMRKVFAAALFALWLLYIFFSVLYIQGVIGGSAGSC